MTGDPEPGGQAACSSSCSTCKALATLGVSTLKTLIPLKPL